MKKYVISIIFAVILIMIFRSSCNAASATISCSSSGKVGEEMTINVTGTGVQWNLALKVNGETIAQSSELDNADGDKSISFSGKYTTSKVGALNVTLVGSVTEYSDASTINNFQSKTISITEKTSNNSAGNGTTSSNGGTTGGQNVSEPTRDNVTTTVSKSSNADLKNLGITPNDFKGFKPATTSYNVTVPNNVEKVSVYATQSDSKATVSGTGAKNLEVGKNTISVTVTAEDGTKKTYTINVTREEEKVTDNTTNNTVDDKTVNETTENEVAEDNLSTTETTNSDLAKLEIAGFTLTPKFSPDIFEYNLKVNEDVTNLDIEAQGANSDVNVEVVGNTDLQDGENVVTIMVYNKKTDKTTTYQIIVEKTKMEIEEVNYNDAIQKAAQIRRIALGAILFIVFCIIIFIIVKRRANIDQRADQYEYDEEDEAKLNLDEEEEFFNRVNKTKLKKIERNESDDIEETLPKSIKQTVPKQEFESKLVVDTSEDDKEEEDTPEYFRTSKSGKKGKHF